MKPQLRAWRYRLGARAHLPLRSLSTRGPQCPLPKSAVWLLATFQNSEVHVGSRTLGGGGREKASQHREWWTNLNHSRIPCTFRKLINVSHPQIPDL